VLAQSRQPVEMLKWWLPLLQDRDRKDVAEQAILDAQRAVKTAGKDRDAQAMAACVEGIALRNQRKFDGARKSLENALNNIRPTSGWRLYAENAYQELTDPEAYYLPQAEALRAAGKPRDAVALLTFGLEAFPEGDGHGALLAMRSLAKLDQARRGSRRLNPNDPLVADANQDAAAAVAAGSKAIGNYAQGRIAEELGQWAKATKSYRAAIEAAPRGERAGSLYRVALAGVLLRLPEVPPADGARTTRLVHFRSSTSRWSLTIRGRPWRLPT
jgi:tetratricopeptide (TPR) repeat protein